MNNDELKLALQHALMEAGKDLEDNFGWYMGDQGDKQGEFTKTNEFVAVCVKHLMKRLDGEKVNTKASEVVDALLNLQTSIDQVIDLISLR